MVLLGIICSLFIAIQDPVFQKFAARFAGGFLSEKTGGDIKVGRLLITPDFTIYLDDVVVQDFWARCLLEPHLQRLLRRL